MGILPFFSGVEEVGVERWNEFDDSYAFVYSNPDKGSKKIIVKCLAMNDKLLVDALREADSEPVHLEIKCVLFFRLKLFILSFLLV